MWLLETSCARLQYFPDPASVYEGYAILSHIWDDVEQTFEDTQALATWCDRVHMNLRDLSRDKIKNFCIVAEKHGYKWGWADSCCIDKSSSTELSEAINSMYRYYGQAQVCYAYLRDVGHENAEEEFKSSAWHRRGWTLQELLAPKFLIFLTHDWCIYHTKFDLARRLEEITRIPVEVLTFSKDINEMSVAQRMSWAAWRTTTRPEDEAYCLMGIFGINMPTLYGEGKGAFRRLQEEIMKHSVDTSLFSWVQRYPQAARVKDSVFQERILQTCDIHEDYDLLADSPRPFSGCWNVSFQGHELEMIDRNTRASSRIPSFIITPHGIRVRIPTKVDRNDSKFVTAIVLNCTRWDTSTHQTRVLHIQFRPCGLTAHLEQPRYHTAGSYFSPLEYDRTTSGDGFVSYSGSKTLETILWKELYVIDRVVQARSSVTSHSTSVLLSHLNASLISPFHIDMSSLQGVRQMPMDIGGQKSTVPWDGSLPLTIPFEDEIYLHLGRCTVGSHPGPVWASIVFQPRDASQESSKQDDTTYATHDCSLDHIEDWEGRRRIVEVFDGTSAVLWFSPSLFYDRILIPHVDLVRRPDLTVEPSRSRFLTTLW